MGLSEEELIERIRRTSQAFSSGDFDRAVEFAHPDAVFVRPGGQSEIRGVGGLRAWMEPDAFESQTIEPSSFEVAGNRVLVHQQVTNRGAGSGLEMQIEGWAVWEFDDSGRVIRLESFLHHEEDEARCALRAP